MKFFPSFRPLGLLFAAALCLAAQAGEPLFRSGDVVATIGGEEMVVGAEAGELELALTIALPELHLTFRSLAWEGDTVYEQRRDLNYPPLEEQLAKMKATAAILQFGQMESLDGPARLPEFIAAYEKLLDRLAGAEGRRLILILPHNFGPPAGPSLPDLTSHNPDVKAYAAAIGELAKRRQLKVSEWQAEGGFTGPDGLHLNARGQLFRAFALGSSAKPPISFRDWSVSNPKILGLIQEKNRLWFNYYRPQNWAFLAGDRVNQPSSRDHLDPTKRWFPGEMEQYLPLIEKKDREIWDAAAALAKKAGQ